MPTPSVTFRSLACALLAAPVLLVSLDAALFRTGLYSRWLEPDSSAGLFELVLQREQANQRDLGPNLVLTLGNSRFAYLPRLANQLTAESGLVFQSAGVAGSDVRSWYYMLRDLDPTARRYKAIVFGVDDYDDEDTTPLLSEDIRALHYSVARLRLSDIPTFAASYQTWPLRLEALRGALLKGYAYRHDFQAFLAKPRTRLAAVRQARGGFREWTYNYELPTHSLAGLSIDWSRFAAHFPSGLDPARRATFDFVLIPPRTPQLGRYGAFRRQWFSRILDHYRGSPTKIIFLKLPRAPLPRPENLVQKTSHSLRDLARERGALLAREDAFVHLERPELFADYYHLNRAGCDLFSAALVRETARLLAP